MSNAFFFDQTKCMSCNACSVACKDWNQVNPGPVRWRHVETYENTASAGIFNNLSMSCNHCEDPACKTACAANAIIKRDDGVVYVDRSLCQGLTTCISACPFAAPHIADDKQEPDQNSSWLLQHPMQKCDMCRERIDVGEKPICVAACAAFALDFGDYEVLRAKYPDAVRLNSTDFPYAYKNNTTETGPAVLIRKRKAVTITKLVSS